jgi:hypothetical protein
MAQTFPLAFASFFQTLEIQRGRVFLPDMVEMSRNGAGELLSASLGARLWRGEFTLAPRPHQTLAGVEAQLRALLQPGASFMVADPRVVGPASDPSGTILGAASVVIATLNVNNRELTLSGLPAGYVITRGDYLSFIYGSSPVRYAMHQVVVGGTASGAGVSPSIEVTPYIRAGAATGATVTLVRPRFKAVLDPRTFNPSDGAQVLSSGLSFGVIQTLR